jgi:nucleoid-associated protein YgaU
VKKAMVTDRQLMNAINFDGKSAAELRARIERALIAEGKVRRVKALAMKAVSDLPIAAQEREAYASEAYAEAVAEEASAAAALEELKAARAHARLTIDIWRTLEASHRVVSSYP